jgi:hypothetical protein
VLAFLHLTDSGPRHEIWIWIHPPQYLQLGLFDSFHSVILPKTMDMRVPFRSPAVGSCDG